MTNIVQGKNGVYKADVLIDINGQLSDVKSSTFFPDSMSEEKVLQVVNRAYEQKKYFSPSKNPNNDTYRKIIDNIEVEMYIEKSSGKLVNSFPAETSANGF